MNLFSAVNCQHCFASSSFSLVPSLSALLPCAIFISAEPTTGMDPVTRRSVWDCINRAKAGRVIVLTTHSMEEADILGDKVAVMSGGRLQAIGTSLHLKNKYGGGFRLSLLSEDASKSEEVKKFVLENAESRFVSEMQGVMLFRLGGTDNSAALSDFFSKLEDQKQALGIVDISIGNATLDDVFINLALQEEQDEETKAISKLNRTYRQAGPQASTAVTSEPNAENNADGVPENSVEPGCTCTSCLYDEPTYCCDWGCGECCQCSSCCKKDNEVPGAITKAASDASANEQKGAQTQTFALVRKNMAFQMRQKWTMCVVISCPMVFLILIALLGALVFDPMTENALSKWKWSCIQETLKYGEHEMPGINVGHISEKNDAYENDDWPPLYGQESASYEFFVGGAASREDIGWLSAGDADWRKGRKLLAISDERYACERAYDKAFENGNTYKEDGKLDKTDVTSMYYTDMWFSRNWTTDYTYESQSCNINRYGTTITQSMSEKPSNVTIWAYKKLEHSRRNCLAKTDANPTEYFTNVTYRVEQQNQVKDAYGGGLLNNFRFNSVDKRFLPIFQSIVNTAYSIMPQAQSCAGFGEDKKMTCDEIPDYKECQENWFEVGKTVSCDWVPPAIANGTQSAFYVNMANYLCDLRNDTSTYTFWALETAITSTQGTANMKTVDAFCTWVENMDSMQGTTAIWAGSTRKELNEALWADWGGKWDDVTNTYRSKFTSYYFTEADKSNVKFSYIAYYNLSATCGLQGGAAEEDCETGSSDLYAPNPSYISATPLTENIAIIQAAMNGAIFKRVLGVGLDFDTKTFPQKLDKCAYDYFGCISINDFIATVFLPYIFSLTIVVIVMLIVYEKTQHLRDIMVMSGLQMRTYWTVNWIFYFCQYMAMMLAVWFVAAIVELRTFTIHNPLIMMLFLVVWGNCMIAFSFLSSAFFKSVWCAIGVEFMIIIISVQAGQTVLIQLLTNPAVGYNEVPYLVYMWFPPITMLRCLLWLIYGAAFNSPCTFENFGYYGYGSIYRCILYMIGQTLIMIPLTSYVENVMSDNARHPLYPYYDLKKWWSEKYGRGVPSVGEPAQVGATAEDEAEDVAAERLRVEKGGENQAVRVLRFRKVFESTKKGVPDKVAVQDLSFGVNKNECFGLLGHNGAGKTTTISMLCGLFKTTSGTAKVADFDLNEEVKHIHQLMGVCPQHDILWNDLTAAEHLLFFARLRKIPEKNLKANVNKALDAVNLLEWANVLSSKFSGGMKRRLSTACSLVGDPKGASWLSLKICFCHINVAVHPFFTN